MNQARLDGWQVAVAMLRATLADDHEAVKALYAEADTDALVRELITGCIELGTAATGSEQELDSVLAGLQARTRAYLATEPTP